MRGRQLAALVVALVLGLVGTATVPTTSGALTGRIVNTTNTAASALYNNCANTARSLGAYFAYPFDEQSGTTAADITTNRRPGTYTSAGVTYGASAPCPRDTGRAVTLNGSSGFVRGVQSASNPQVFSVQVWFRTTTASGGKLVGLGNNTGMTDASGQYDRHIYMTNDGRLVFGVYPGAFRTVTSSNAYNDGSWHHVVGTLSAASGETLGLRLYVDGSLVASDTATTRAEDFTGTWRFGFDNLGGWPNIPQSSYFAGSLAYGAVFTTALTPAQVRALNRAGR